MEPEELAKFFIGSKNITPLDDFDGFSPHEMHEILYFPFTKECPIQIRPALDNNMLNIIPIFNIVKYLLVILNKDNGLKLTPKGNLPLKVIKEIYNQKYIVDEFIEKGITKIHREENWIALYTIKRVLKLSGISRTYKGKLVITKQTKNDLEKGRFSNIFFKFFQGYTTRFNWAYNDRFENEENGQIGFLYLLYLVNKYGRAYRDSQFYADLYFKAFPIFNIEEQRIEGIKYKERDRVIQTRFFKRFANWFGFVEIQYEDDKKYFSRSMTIKRTELLSNLLAINSNS